MMRILSGKEVAAALTQSLAKKASSLKENGILPTLAILRLGEDEGDLSYERGAVSRCAKAGIEVRRIAYPADTTQDTLLQAIDSLNMDESVHGVLLLRPLPAHLDACLIENRLEPSRDVDGMTDLSMSGVFTGRKLGFAPCTPEAVLRILDHYGIACQGRHAVIVGRSLVFGRPAAMLLMQRNATVTICHTGTEGLPRITRQADILVCAAGRAGMIRPEHIREGQTVIDVGIHMGADGKLCGDVSPEAGQLAGCITPVPGGVGAVTTTVLADHVLRAAQRRMES